MHPLLPSVLQRHKLAGFLAFHSSFHPGYSPPRRYVACQNERKGVLILSEFAGAAQSLGAGAILVNPWNVSDVAASIEDALTMSEAERAERHKHNFQHVTVHTAQAWADTFVSELNDTLVEAELRTLKIPPLLSPMRATEAFRASQNRLIVLVRRRTAKDTSIRALLGGELGLGVSVPTRATFAGFVFLHSRSAHVNLLRKCRTKSRMHGHAVWQGACSAVPKATCVLPFRSQSTTGRSWAQPGLH